MVYVSDSEHWLQELQFHHRAKLANGNCVSGMRTIASNAASLLRFLTMCSRGDKLGYWRSIIIFCGRKLPKIIYSVDLNWRYDFDAENKRHLVFPVYSSLFWMVTIRNVWTWNSLTQDTAAFMTHTATYEDKNFNDNKSLIIKRNLVTLFAFHPQEIAPCNNLFSLCSECSVCTYKYSMCVLWRLEGVRGKLQNVDLCLILQYIIMAPGTIIKPTASITTCWYRCWLVQM